MTKENWEIYYVKAVRDSFVPFTHISHVKEQKCHFIPQTPHTPHIYNRSMCALDVATIT